MRLEKLSYLKYYAKILFDNWTNKKESYAQHGEDRLIDLLLPSGVTSFIDIGANDGVLFSNTYKFAKMGASGLCVEPSKSSHTKLKLNHLFHHKVKCVNSAISDQNSIVFLQEAGYEKTLSRVDKKATKNSIRVKCQTFDKLISRYPKFEEIDLLSIDVEGHEKEIFKGLTNKKFRSKLIVIESDKTQTNELLTLDPLKEYRSIYTNGINTIFVHCKEFHKMPRVLPEGFEEC